MDRPASLRVISPVLEESRHRRTEEIQFDGSAARRWVLIFKAEENMDVNHSLSIRPTIFDPRRSHARYGHATRIQLGRKALRMPFCASEKFSHI
jgi:hypothetical protein